MRRIDGDEWSPGQVEFREARVGRGLVGFGEDFFGESELYLQGFPQVGQRSGYCLIVELAEAKDTR